MQELSPEVKLRRAFEELYGRVNFIASIVAGWKLEKTYGIKTMATDGPGLFYNPGFVDAITIADTVDVGLHEAAHIFRGHHMRENGRDHHRWNEACDLSIHGDSNLRPYFNPTGVLLTTGCVPGRGSYASLPMDKDAEWYYAALTKQQQAEEPQPKAETGEPEDGDSEWDREPDAEDGGEEQPEDSEDTDEEDAEPKSNEPDEADGDAEGDGSPTGTTAKPAQGSAEGSAQGGEPYELPDATEWGEVMEHPEQATDPDKVEEQWQDQVARGINDAREAGTLPGWLKEFGELVYGDQTAENWRLHMARFLTKHSPTKMSYNRPSRKHGYRGDIIMPGRYAKDAGDGAVITDVSGSMDVAAMDATFREMEGIFSTYQRCRITLFQADVRLLPDERVFTKQDFPITVPPEWMGRGGTTLWPAIKQVAESGRFKWLIVVSDMLWDPAEITEEPAIPTLWVMTREPFFGLPKYGQAIGPVPVAQEVRR